MFLAASRINSPKLEPEKSVKRQINFPSSKDVGCSLEVPKDGPPLSHGKEWIPLSHRKGWIPLSHMKGWPSLSHGKGWPPLSHGRGWSPAHPRERMDPHSATGRMDPAQPWDRMSPHSATGKDGPSLCHGKGWPSSHRKDDRHSATERMTPTQPRERMAPHSATGKDGSRSATGNSQRDERTWAQTKMQTKRPGCRVHFCGILEDANSLIALKSDHFWPGVGFEWERAGDNFWAIEMLCVDWEWINGFVRLSKLTELNS